MNSRQPTLNEFYTDKTILLTGTTGFLGKHSTSKVIVHNVRQGCV